MYFRLVLSIEIIMKTPKHLKAWLKFWRRTTLWEHDYRPVWKQWLYKWFEFVSCECGEKRRVLKTDLIKKHSTSCWCYNKDLLREKNTKHWDSKTKFYQHYRKAKQRCECETDEHFYWYWARWIKFGWGTYEDFKRDMYPSYLSHCEEFWEGNTSLDRVNVDWDYNKENCARVTKSENCWQHKRTNRKYKYWISADEISKLTWLSKEKIYYKFCREYDKNFAKLKKSLLKNNFNYLPNIKNEMS